MDVNMQRNIEGLDKLNKELEEYLLGDASDEHIGFNKLVMVEGMDPKLREALILLHSKYTAELEAVKKYHFKYISNLINSNKEAYLKMEALKNELNKELEKINSRKIFSIPKVVFVAISIVFVFGSFFYMFTIDKEAGAMLVDIIKHSLKALVENKDLVKE